VGLEGELLQSQRKYPSFKEYNTQPSMHVVISTIENMSGSKMMIPGAGESCRGSVAELGVRACTKATLAPSLTPTSTGQCRIVAGCRVLLLTRVESLTGVVLSLMGNGKATVLWGTDGMCREELITSLAVTANVSGGGGGVTVVRGGGGGGVNTGAVITKKAFALNDRVVCKHTGLGGYIMHVGLAGAFLVMWDEVSCFRQGLLLQRSHLINAAMRVQGARTVLFRCRTKYLC
jgi:hypothetical protein